MTNWNSSSSQNIESTKKHNHYNLSQYVRVLSPVCLSDREQWTKVAVKIKARCLPHVIIIQHGEGVGGRVRGDRLCCCSFATTATSSRRRHHDMGQSQGSRCVHFIILCTFDNLVYFFTLHLKRRFINPGCGKSSGLVLFYARACVCVCVCVWSPSDTRRTINSSVCIRMQKDHIRTLKILQSTSEFGGLWKHRNNPVCAKSDKSYDCWSWTQ